jgi:hypothetical protein
MRRAARPLGAVAVLTAFAVLAVLQTAPLSLQPARGVRDAGDPLLNTWIMSWVGHQLLRDPAGLFQAGIFHPYPNALAFSEHLLPPALIAAPVSLLTGNPILAYNFVFLLAFVLSGFGTFLLVRALSGSAPAGFLAGVIFSFASYKIMHISHLQLLWSVGMPFFFLFLHRFMDRERSSDAWLFALFLTIQALSCVYYGLFSLAVLALALPLLVLFRRRRMTVRFLLRLALPLAAAGAVLVLFSLPYTSAFRTMGLMRELNPGAELQNYLAPFPTGIALGKLLSGLGSPERYLLPGLAALVLAGIGLRLAWGGRRKKGAAPPSSRAGRIFAAVLAVLAVFNALAIIASLLGGTGFKLGPLKLSATGLIKPILNLFLLGVLALAARAVRHFRIAERSERAGHILVYALLSAWAMMLSFGSGFAFLGKTTVIVPMPFQYFYRHVLGFNGVREPVRFAVFVLFGVAVLAGFGAARLFASLKKPAGRTALFLGLAAVLNLEYLSVPIDGVTVPVGRDVPPTYRWLKGQPDRKVVLEYPFHAWIADDSIYLYMATYHWKRLVNGYSGFIPASTFLIRDATAGFPDAESLEVLETLGADTIVVHAKMLPGGPAGERARRILESADPRLKIVERFSYGFSRPNALSNEMGEDYVLALTAAGGDRGAPPQGIAPVPLREIPAASWTLTTPVHPDLVRSIADGEMSTNWATGEPQKPGQQVTIDLGRDYGIGKIEVRAGAAAQDFGCSYRIEASDDGEAWRELPFLYSRTAFLRALLRGQAEAAQELWTGGARARYLRLVQTGTRENIGWTIAELRIFESAALPGGPLQ